MYFSNYLKELVKEENNNIVLVKITKIISELSKNIINKGLVDNLLKDYYTIKYLILLLPYSYKSVSLKDR